jgi:hypothetical protein
LAGNTKEQPEEDKRPASSESWDNDQTAMSTEPRFAAVRERVGANRTAALVPGWMNRPIDRDLTRLVLEDHFITEEFQNAIKDGEIIENMEGATAVSFIIEDPQRNLLHRGLLDKWVNLNARLNHVSRDKHRHLHVVATPEWRDIHGRLDGRDLALAGVTKSGNEFSLTMENRAVNELRKYRSHKTWNRATFTRAQAIKSMVEEVKGYKIPFYCPELDKKQPITSVAVAPTSSQNSKTMSPGFAPNAHITVKGATATAQQKSYIARVLNTGISLGAPHIVLVAAIMTITQESDVHIDTAPSAVGLFDQNPAWWPATGTDIEKDATAFYKGIPGADGAIALAQKNPSWTPGEIAQGVQASAYPSAYDQWETEATATVAAFGGGTTTGGTTTTTTEFNKFMFSRGTQGKPENSWDAITRLAQEVNWHVFMLDNTLYYVEDEQMIKQQPYDTISEKDDGIDEINYDIDEGKKVSQVTVEAHVDRWQTPPGAVVVVNDGGPADGPWLVHQNRWPLFGSQAEITLQLPTPPKKEPAPTTRTVTKTTGGTTGTLPPINQRGVINPMPHWSISNPDYGIDADAAEGTPLLAPAPCHIIYFNPNFYAYGLVLCEFDVVLQGAASQFWYYSEYLQFTSTTTGHSFKQGDVVATRHNGAFEIGWGYDVRKYGTSKNGILGQLRGLTDHSGGAGSDWSQNVYGKSFAEYFGIPHP